MVVVVVGDGLAFIVPADISLRLQPLGFLRLTSLEICRIPG